MASQVDIVHVLQRVPLFSSLNNHQLSKLAKRCYERQWTAGQQMVTQGQTGEGIFIIVTGKAEVCRERADGTKVVVNTFGPMDFFGELALLDDGPRTATVTATEATTGLALARWEFLTILNADAEMAVAIAQEIARRFRVALDALQ